VSIRGITEHEVVPLARFARQHGLEMRFIEYMPIGADHWERDKVYFAHEILEIAAVIRKNVQDKWEGHEINTSRFIKPLRTMHAIGG
jgi:molybdenum cofactor biosynthesis enzyme MoaA